MNNQCRSVHSWVNTVGGRAELSYWVQRSQYKCYTHHRKLSIWWSNYRQANCERAYDQDQDQICSHLCRELYFERYARAISQRGSLSANIMTNLANNCSKSAASSVGSIRHTGALSIINCSQNPGRRQLIWWDLCPTQNNPEDAAFDLRPSSSWLLLCLRRIWTDIWWTCQLHGLLQREACVRLFDSPFRQLCIFEIS